MSALVQPHEGTLSEGENLSLLANLARIGHFEVSVSETLGFLGSRRDVLQAAGCWLVVHPSVETPAFTLGDAEMVCGEARHFYAAGYEGTATSYVSAPSSREFVAMAQWCDDAYDIEDYALVLAHLSRYPDLMLPLRLIPDRTRLLSGPHNRPRLRMVMEDDSIENAFLVAAVPTMLDVSEAARILDDLDDDWWLDQSRAINGRLVLTIDYL